MAVYSPFGPSTLVKQSRSNPEQTVRVSGQRHDLGKKTSSVDNGCRPQAQKHGPDGRTNAVTHLARIRSLK